MAEVISIRTRRPMTDAASELAQAERHYAALRARANRYPTQANLREADEAFARWVHLQSILGDGA